jgi:hypothetical protein
MYFATNFTEYNIFNVALKSTQKCSLYRNNRKWTLGNNHLWTCLVVGVPILIYLIDLGGGIRVVSKQITPENISSFPFNAFLKGLSALEWPRQRHYRIKSFLGMIAHTAEHLKI